MAVEMLTPDGNRRVVVDDSVADALLSRDPPFIMIEPTSLPINARADQFGLTAPDPEPSDDAADGPDASDQSDFADADDGEVTASSTDVTAKEAIAAIAELETEADVYAYADGDDRVTVRNAADERAEDLREADE